MNKIIVVSVVTFLLGAGVGYSMKPKQAEVSVNVSSNSQLEQNKELVRNLLNIFHKDSNLDNINQYISEDYTQNIDNQTVYFNDFVNHIKEAKDNTDNIQITVEDMIAENNKVAAVQVREFTKKDGTKITTKSISVYDIKDGKITNVTELNNIISQVNSIQQPTVGSNNAAEEVHANAQPTIDHNKVEETQATEAAPAAPVEHNTQPAAN